LAAEKEVLGFYLSSHPLAEHEATLKTYCTHGTPDVAGAAPRSEVVLGGMLSSIKFSQTRNARAGSSNTKYAMFDLEDMQGSVRCIIWPEEFAQHAHLVQADATLVVIGAVDRRPGSEESNIIVNELVPLAELAGRFTRGIIIRVSEQQHAERGLENLHEILRGYPGGCELQLLLCLADGRRVVMKSEGLRVELNAQMRGRIDALLGPGNVRLIAAPPKPSGAGRGGPARALARR
jgi:DNA polymerase-3 subunit alpha